MHAFVFVLDLVYMISLLLYVHLLLIYIRILRVRFIIRFLLRGGCLLGGIGRFCLFFWRATGKIRGGPLLAVLSRSRCHCICRFIQVPTS